MLSPCNVVVIVMLIVVFYSDPPPRVLSLSSRRHSSGEGLDGVLAVVMLIPLCLVVVISHLAIVCWAA